MTHDAMRLLARHGTALVAIGEDGIRFYSAMPFGPGDSVIAREQARCWSDATGRRIGIARQMYAWRLGEIFPESEIAVLRGIEGARMKETYLRVAQQFGIVWNGRRYDRANPMAADEPNQAINHAASAVEAAAMIAVAVTGAIPQLGFIHEDSGNAFCLDLADLHRDTITLPGAFGGVKEAQRTGEVLERCVRRVVGKMLRKAEVIPMMIGQIKKMFTLPEKALPQPVPVNDALIA